MAAAKTLAEALLNVQKAAPKLEKDGKNPFFNNAKYVTLDALISTVQPLLQAEGVLLMQPLTNLPTATDMIPALETTFTHAATGESQSRIVPLVLDKQTSQGLGSAVTYTRRYALASALGLISETDDDGNSASSNKAASKDPTEAEMKKATFAIAKAALEKDRPTVAEVAKFFGVQTSDMQDKEVLARLLKEHGAA